MKEWPRWSAAGLAEGRKTALLLCVFVLTASALPGCAGNSATIHGKVSCNGKDVTDGTLSFAPVATSGNTQPGKPGMAQIQADGSYTVTVYGSSGGVLADHYAIRYIAGEPTPPPGKATYASADMVPSPYQGFLPKQAEVEIKPGDNTIQIELVPGPKRPGGS